jgi:ariadne-1
MLDDHVAKIMKLLPITASQAKLLLQLNNWDMDKISEEAKENSDELLIKNGLKVKPKEEPKSDRRLGLQLRVKRDVKNSVKQQPLQCGVCWEEDVEFLALECGHKFCLECWPNHIKTQVLESKSILSHIFITHFRYLPNQMHVRKVRTLLFGRLCS